jgi:hypothetical protein
MRSISENTVRPSVNINLSNADITMFESYEADVFGRLVIYGARIEM